MGLEWGQQVGEWEERRTERKGVGGPGHEGFAVYSKKVDFYLVMGMFVEG